MLRRLMVVLCGAILVFALSITDGPGGLPARADHLGDEGFDLPIHMNLEHHLQHGSSTGHIAGSVDNVELVGVWRAPRTTGRQFGIVTDVWSHGSYAYLGTFAPPCAALGVNVIDISNPARPKKVRFIPSRPGSQVNDVKVFHFEGLASGFSGDLLLHSNEFCALTPATVGGISIWDVTNPAKATRLAEGVGDRSADNTPGAITRLRARQVHDISAWQDGNRAYAALVDDEELTDLDILDITDPRNPVHIADVGLPDWPTANVNAFGDEAFLHDVWFQLIDGVPTLLLSYWDAGWILMDVTDPTSPVFLGDSDYPDPDPLSQERLGLTIQPEGNAHAGVWSLHDGGQFILAGDEDFSPFRLPFQVTSGPLMGQSFSAGEFGWTVPISTFPGGMATGPTVFGGYGCRDDRGDVPLASVLDPFVGPDDERIIVFQRGPVLDPNHDHAACFFSEKVESGELAGYDVVIIANHHVGSGAGAFPDAFICGGQGSPVLGIAAGICIGHRWMHEAFGTTPDYTVPYPSPAPDEPTIETIGPRIEVQSFFDGWGPLHLLDATTLGEIDAWAPGEVFDPAFAQGFGDLTMHNVEADPDENLAYISWYSLGLQVVRFDETGITPVGHYIDAGGNNFWGIHVADDHPTQEGLILASDRDSGLWIFRYTGP